MKTVRQKKNAVASTYTFRRRGHRMIFFKKKSGERIKVAKVQVEYYYQLRQKLSMCTNRNVKL